MILYHESHQLNIFLVLSCLCWELSHETFLLVDKLILYLICTLLSQIQRHFNLNGIEKAFKISEGQAFFIETQRLLELLVFTFQFVLFHFLDLLH